MNAKKLSAVIFVAVLCGGGSLPVIFAYAPDTDRSWSSGLWSYDPAGPTVVDGAYLAAPSYGIPLYDDSIFYTSPSLQSAEAVEPPIVSYQMPGYWNYADDGALQGRSEEGPAAAYYGVSTESAAPVLSDASAVPEPSQPVTTTSPSAPAAPAPTVPDSQNSTGRSGNELRTVTATGSVPLFFARHGTGGDWLPHFAAASTKVASASGNWSRVWGGNPPAKNDIVRIPEGVHVVYDLPDSPVFQAVAVEGTLSFAPYMDTRLRVGTILVYEGGTLVLEPQDPHRAEVVFTGELDTTKDGGQFTLGLIALGKVRIEGAFRTPYVKTDLFAGADTMPEPTASGWRVGDVLFFSDSQSGVDASHWSLSSAVPNLQKALMQQWEMRAIKEIRDGTVYLNRPLGWHHVGYAANLSRNVSVRSHLSDTNEPLRAISERAHVMIAGHADAAIKNAAFIDLGRTTASVFDDAVFGSDGRILSVGENQRGRYPLHTHHLMSPFLIEGAVVYGSAYERAVNGTMERGLAGSPKWGIVNHNSFGTIRNNVVVGASGAGIVGEDGTETGLVEDNLVIGTGAGTGGGDDGRFVESQGKDLGHGGFGYWFRGPFMDVRHNIAAGYFKQGGFGYFLHPEFSKSAIQNVAGAPDEFRGQTINVTSRPISFTGNRAEGIFGEAGLVMFYSSIDHLVSDFRVKNGNRNGKGLDVRYIEKLTLENSSLEGSGSGTGVHTNLKTKVVDLVGVAIKNFGVGFKVPQGGTFVNNGSFANSAKNIVIELGTVLPGRLVSIENSIFSRALVHISMEPTLIRIDNFNTETLRQMLFGANTRVVLSNYNKLGRDYEVFFKEQDPHYVIARTYKNDVGDNVLVPGEFAGKSNREVWQQFGIAVNGAPVARNVVSGIDGYVKIVR